MQRKGSEATSIQADERSVSQTVKLLDEAVTRFSRSDIAVRIAGALRFRYFKDVAEEAFDRLFNLDTRGQVFVAREAYKHLVKGGRIFIISSNIPENSSVPKYSLYLDSKGEVDSFVRMFCKDTDEEQIAANTVVTYAASLVSTS